MLNEANQFRLIQIGLTAVVAISLIAWWLRRRRRESSAFAKAQFAAAMLNHAEAIRLLLDAEANWTFNAAHDTPKQANLALLRLRQIVVQIVDHARQVQRNVGADTLLEVIDLLCRAYTERRNHQWGTLGTALNSRAEKEVGTLRSALEMERASFRTACQEANLT